MSLLSPCGAGRCLSCWPAWCRAGARAGCSAAVEDGGTGQGAALAGFHADSALSGLVDTCCGSMLALRRLQSGCLDPELGKTGSALCARSTVLRVKRRHTPFERPTARRSSPQFLEVLVYVVFHAATAISESRAQGLNPKALVSSNTVPVRGFMKRQQLPQFEAVECQLRGA